MLVGRADVRRLAERAGAIDEWVREPLVLESVETLNVVYEIESETIEDVLPPALHPTLPPTATWVFYRSTSSPVGPFELAQLRIGCRCGVRPRGFVLWTFVDRDAVAGIFSNRWGYGTSLAEVRLRRYYDEIVGTVSRGGQALLSVVLRNPDPLSPSDVQYTASMALAETPVGLRLVQVEPEFTIRRAERGKPRLVTFDAAAWGEERIRPAYPVSASATVSDVTIPRVRFVCKPDVLAFEGTEAIG